MSPILNKIVIQRSECADVLKQATEYSLTSTWDCHNQVNSLSPQERSTYKDYFTVCLSLPCVVFIITTVSYVPTCP